MTSHSKTDIFPRVIAYGENVFHYRMRQLSHPIFTKYTQHEKDNHNAACSNKRSLWLNQ